MEDQSQSISPSPVTLAKQALTEKVWNLLVSAYTDNLSLNLDRFLRQNHLNRKRVEENLAEFGRSFESARFAAIIARRERKKALTRARNEKARADLQGNPDADFILEQANLLYANEHQHSAGTDGWKPQE